MALYTGALDRAPHSPRSSAHDRRDSGSRRKRRFARRSPRAPAWRTCVARTTRSSITCSWRSRATRGIDLDVEATGDLRASPHRGRRHRARPGALPPSRRRPARATASARCPWTTRSCRSCSTSVGVPYYAARCRRRMYDHFLRSFADNAKATLHVRVLRGHDKSSHRRGRRSRRWASRCAKRSWRRGAVFSTKGSVRLEISEE